jgi:two-component system phosphate regulon sensor histidine kinase PhoR
MTGFAGNLLAWALALLLAVLVAYLFAQAGQRRALIRWLANPGSDMPDGRGPWREVFSMLQRREKESRRATDHLARSLDHFRLATQALPDGVILLDDQTHIEWMNTAAVEHFGLDAKRDVGTLAGQLIRQGEFHAYLTAFKERRIGADPFQLRLTGEAATRVVSLLLIPFADSGILLLSRDVTDLVRADVIRRDFVANVSHELRTPLTVISGFLEQFASEHPPTGETARRFLALMADQAGRMNRLVTDLLTLSRLENDSQAPRNDAIDLAALLDSILAEAKALSGDRHVFVTKCMEPLQLRGSPEEIRSAFGNLVSNAVRYTPEGGTITLSLKYNENGLVFEVADTGIGIPKEHLSRLTERFYRIDKGRSAATGGTGLGLAIVKHVLLRHDARLEIASVPGKGSVFSAVFPANRATVATKADNTGA